MEGDSDRIRRIYSTDMDLDKPMLKDPREMMEAAMEWDAISEMYEDRDRSRNGFGFVSDLHEERTSRRNPLTGRYKYSKGFNPPRRVNPSARWDNLPNEVVEMILSRAIERDVERIAESLNGRIILSNRFNLSLVESRTFSLMEPPTVLAKRTMEFMMGSMGFSKGHPSSYSEGAVMMLMKRFVNAISPSYNARMKGKELLIYKDKHRVDVMITYRHRMMLICISIESAYSEPHQPLLDPIAKLLKIGSDAMGIQAYLPRLLRPSEDERLYREGRSHGEAIRDIMNELYGKGLPTVMNELGFVKGFFHNYSTYTVTYLIHTLVMNEAHRTLGYQKVRIEKPDPLWDTQRAPAVFVEDDDGKYRVKVLNTRNTRACMIWMDGSHEGGYLLHHDERMGIEEWLKPVVSEIVNCTGMKLLAIP